MLKKFSARLRKGDNKGAWTYVVMDGSAEFFGTRGLVKVRGSVDGQPFDVNLQVLYGTPPTEEGPLTAVHGGSIGARVRAARAGPRS